MHTLANKISARERETAPKYYYKVHICLQFKTLQPCHHIREISVCTNHCVAGVVSTHHRM